MPCAMTIYYNMYVYIGTDQPHGARDLVTNKRQARAQQAVLELGQFGDAVHLLYTRRAQVYLERQNK